MTLAWLSPTTAPAMTLAQGMAQAAPVFATERLRLRLPVLADYPAYEAVLTSDRARYVDGPYSPAGAWADFAEGVAGWLLRGAGVWTVTPLVQDIPLGWIYLWQQRGRPEPELGFIFTAAAEGQGYAHEAASAVLPHAVRLFGAGGFVSYIHRDNAPSARLATRLGAVRDPQAEAAYGQPLLHIYRHATTLGVS